MSEFHFYGSGDDALSVLEAILEPGDIFVTPSLNHRTPSPQSYRRIEKDLSDALAKNRRLYVTGAFSKSPLHLKLIEGGDYAGTYVIDQYRGGPSLAITLPDCKLLDGVTKHLLPGVLFCPSVFWFDDRPGSYRPPADVKAATQALKKRIKLVVKRRVVGKRNVWIGVGGFELLQQSEALILLDGKWVDRQGLIIRSNIQQPIPPKKPARATRESS